MEQSVDVQTMTLGASLVDGLSAVVVAAGAVAVSFGLAGFPLTAASRTEETASWRREAFILKIGVLGKRILREECGYNWS